jgi:hypothetical protein
LVEPLASSLEKVTADKQDLDRTEPFLNVSGHFGEELNKERHWGVAINKKV